MKLLKEIYNHLINLPPVPPERGGIIGCKNGVGVTICEDICSKENAFSYVPNVQYLNKEIEQWYDNNISLYAIYHTHVNNGYKLSKQDEAYIKKIVCTIPNKTDDLYFPIVIPNDKIVVYKTSKSKKQIYIIQDELILI